MCELCELRFVAATAAPLPRGRSLSSRQAIATRARSKQLVPSCMRQEALKIAIGQAVERAEGRENGNDN
jgi:hypothetical protein